MKNKKYIYGLGDPRDIGIDPKTFSIFFLKEDDVMVSNDDLLFKEVPERFSKLRYIGETKSPLERLIAHINDVGNSKKQKWVRELVDEGVIPYMLILDSCSRNEKGLEGYYIIRLFNLIKFDILNVANFPLTFYEQIEAATSILEHKNMEVNHQAIAKMIGVSEAKVIKCLEKKRIYNFDAYDEDYNKEMMNEMNPNSIVNDDSEAVSFLTSLTKTSQI